MRKHPIAQFMAAQGIQTQAEAARILGLRDQQEVSDYITWRHVPRPRKMRALAQKLNCQLSMFIPDAGHGEA